MAGNGITRTRFDGVLQRESTDRKFKGKPDVCFYISYYDPVTGKRVRKSVGWRSEGFSAEMAAGMRRDLLSEGKHRAVLGDAYIAPKSTHELTFGESYAIYQRDWRAKSNPRAKAFDAYLYSNHLRVLDVLPLSALTAHRLTKLMTDIECKGLSPQTVRHTVALIRRVMRKMQQWQLWRGEMPFSNITLPKLNNARDRYLTPDEAQRLLERLRAHSPRVWIMSLISLHCGLRFGEVARLTYGDIDTATRTLTVMESKAGRARNAVLTDAVCEALATLPPGVKNSLLFPARDGGVMKAISSAYDRAVNALGLNDNVSDRRKRVVFHTLRHTYASWLAMSGQGQTMIADLLGHASLEMSRRYTHLMPDARRATALAIDDIFRHGSPPEPNPS